MIYALGEPGMMCIYCRGPIGAFIPPKPGNRCSLGSCPSCDHEFWTTGAVRGGLLDRSIDEICLIEDANFLKGCYIALAG